MAIGYGNVTPAPGYSYVDEISHVEILASTAGLTQTGVTLAPSQGVLAAGTALGRVTATGLWKAYSNSASDGTQVCRGILRDAVDTSDGVTYVANIVTAGMLVNSKLTGIDSAAVTDLNARQDTVLDIFQF